MRGRRSVSGPLHARDWSSIRTKVFHKDDYTCAYCGFRSLKFQQIYSENGMEKSATDFKTICIFCEQCLDLKAAADHGSGVLAWLPEVGQIELHHMCRAIYAFRHNDGNPVAEAANKILDTIMARRTEAKRRIGTDDPLVLATVLLENLDDSEYEAREARIDGMRLVPLPRRITHTPQGEVDLFPQILAYWTSTEGPLSKASGPETWPKLYTEMKKILAA